MQGLTWQDKYKKIKPKLKHRNTRSTNIVNIGKLVELPSATVVAER